MKNILNFTFAILTIFTAFSQNANEAKKLLDEVSVTMNSYDDIYISFDYVFENKEGGIDAEVSEGDAILKGDKYVVNIFGITRIFDGAETYTIIHENEEVNISNSDDDTSVLLTPSELINFHKNGYTYYLGKLENVKGKQIRYVNLTPIDTESEIASVQIGIDIKNKHIVSVKHIGENDSETTIKIKNLEYNKSLNDSLFSFNEKEYEKKNYTINR